MNSDPCPICDGPTEVRSVAPCFDCGHEPREIGEFRRGEHSFALYSLLGVELVLCDFCDADFGSYVPEYLGFPIEAAHDYPLVLERGLPDPSLSSDHYCPTCGHRRAFLVALREVRARAAA